jgi:hypothetical protein
LEISNWFQIQNLQLCRVQFMSQSSVPGKLRSWLLNLQLGTTPAL